MRGRLFGALAAAALSLSACTGTGLNSTPAGVADQTRLDEQVGIGAEVAYTTATKLGTALATAGVIDKAAFKRADAKAYAALLTVRSAYRAGNSADYITASAQVYAAVAEIQALVK